MLLLILSEATTPRPAELLIWCIAHWCGEPPADSVLHRISSAYRQVTILSGLFILALRSANAYTQTCSPRGIFIQVLRMNPLAICLDLTLSRGHFKQQSHLLGHSCLRLCPSPALHTKSHVPACRAYSRYDCPRCTANGPARVLHVPVGHRGTMACRHPEPIDECIPLLRGARLRRGVRSAAGGDVCYEFGGLFGYSSDQRSSVFPLES